MIEKTAVKNFLTQFHASAKVWGIKFIDERTKNFQALAVLEITSKLREEILMKLTVEDYSEGPVKDKMSGWTDMWVFGKVVKKVEIYIKITLGFKGIPGCICVSFHPAEHPMVYPLKGQNK